MIPTGNLCGEQTMPSKADVVKKAKAIIESKKYTYKQSRAEGYLDDAYMDCSEFVLQSYRQAGYVEFRYSSTALMSSGLKAVKTPEAGDIVYWPGHVGIVTDPITGDFVHAASTKSGLRSDNDLRGYWSMHGKAKFLQYK